ncbi:DUF2917 domain-containing protein [Undibacterium sp. FT147W]|uniref:DUF2917 domain-containing protein n=1 Tax=Undibacterium rivi TaxID=2828729 RepID=A0ABS5H5S6_9BURK|nr:DUF2917 domain-containing protein [Undibacterium rivi]MBR7794228.1 DUF2917 domain-containing protein [Undibacterium rivi]
MPANHRPALQQLHPGMLISVVPEQMLTLHIHRGLVWVTVEGDETDYWLRAGDLLPLPPLRHAVIEADGKDVSELSMLIADLHHAALPVSAQTALNPQTEPVATAAG